ncbi:hypothetical protein Tco_0222879, partial [Tanacetum coccineum]
MSETEPIPPTSSVTALRIPIIKKGEYDLWSMKMRQYIAITDHILWDIITNGNQTTTDPASPSVSAPKTSLAANARRNNEKALNILLSAIPDRHLLSFHDAVDARSLWKAIKARFGGNEASKKMQKNLLKQQFETFTIGSREELDSAYERFQHILSMLELHDATVSIEDANLKFLRSLPSVWHVVATMIRGQPGLDELDFDDLYNNLKVYEHELKGVSNSSSPNIAFLSTEVKGSTLKQSTAEPTNIPKGYTQAASSKVPTAPNYASHSDEIICSFFSQQASMPTTHDDEDLLQIDEDAMEEIDIGWQVAMITARIRKFMRKTGRPIDLKPNSRSRIKYCGANLSMLRCDVLIIAFSRRVVVMDACRAKPFSRIFVSKVTALDFCGQKACMAESSILRAFSLFLLAFAASEVFGADTEGDAGSVVVWFPLNEGTDEVLEGTAQEYKSTAGANLSTAE